MTAQAIDVAGTGFTVLDRIYESGEPSIQALGGSCGNVLVSLAMLNRAVCPILALGSDEVGDRLVSEFEEAGADVRYIFRRSELASPVLAQNVDTDSGQHTFSFICPETDKHFPTFKSIDRGQVCEAKAAITSCSIFYADRLSEAICEAMEAAANAGALVYFEPSAIGDSGLFERALKLAAVLKFSADRMCSDMLANIDPSTILIVTRGIDGLLLRQGDRSFDFAAVPAPVVRDTCGSGDMVSVAVIDRLLSRSPRGIRSLLVDDVFEGVWAGQKLAAANCAYVGARGVFKQAGAGAVRRLLDDFACEERQQLELFSGA